MPLNAVTTYSNMQYDFSDNTQGGIKEMNDLSYFVHGSTAVVPFIM